MNQDFLDNFQDLVQSKRSAGADKDLLILKATTAQTVKCLEQCTILLRQHATYLSRTNQLNPNFGQIQYPTNATEIPTVDEPGFYTTTTTPTPSNQAAQKYIST